MPPILPQTVLRRYRVVENAPIADGQFKLVVEAVDANERVPEFKAGQWVYIHLLNPDGSDWARAAYSIVSAPSDGSHRIEFGIKMAGDFTKRAAALRVGDELNLQGPWGVFGCKPEQPRHVMIAGGIGVTPFIAIIREAIAANTKGHEFILFYSVRTPEEAAYLAELKSIAAAHPHIRIVATSTRGTSPDWKEETGRLSEVLFDRHLSDYATGEYLLCGPKEFMQAMRDLLVVKGADPKRIKQELFG